jgi:TPP-dependent indolepyruvate ferredoxin oxidoreductase alpha subunit
LTKFWIDENLCRGCTLCATKCAIGAIIGEKGQPHKIDQMLCRKCGACIEVCKFQAIKGGKS